MLRLRYNVGTWLSTIMISNKVWLVQARCCFVMKITTLECIQRLVWTLLSTKNCLNEQHGQEQIIFIILPSAYSWIYRSTDLYRKCPFWSTCFRHSIGKLPGSDHDSGRIGVPRCLWINNIKRFGLISTSAIAEEMLIQDLTLDSPPVISYRFSIWAYSTNCAPQFFKTLVGSSITMLC